MKQHHLTQTLLQWLLLGFIAAPLLAGCNDSDDKGNPDPQSPGSRDLHRDARRLRPTRR